MNHSPALLELSARVGHALVQHQLRLACAESCTGGGIAALITATAGSSAWFECGFITYSNESKQYLLGVLPATLQQHGAVSEAVVDEMTRGALSRSHGRAQVSLAVSGIAGPGGSTTDKPVGTVCFGWCLADSFPITTTCHFDGDRHTVQQAAIIHALNGLLALLGCQQAMP
ncbi:MAG: nicotinamide-nucleotide amidohydrolase family protein [Sterolibacterium sp.]|nr:nicotinamide-nucleotide amidohydrolase family protein [Sterolibacterium sp.]MBP9798974.1 nicotinamide-nucleotide amidohydrolase family protein [Sterolibacterium sp.]